MYRKTKLWTALPLLAMVCLPLPISAKTPSQDETGGTPPRLVVVLSIDQMRYDYLERFGKLFTGGFRTLLRSGALFTSARYRHANCSTGPGHAVMLSGLHGSHSGMIANAWYDQHLHKAVNVIEDPVHAPVGGKGRSASPANFLGYTLGDMLKQRSPESKVVGVSLKDRAAILMAGRRADAAYWFESTGGNFITSSFYMRTAPPWLDRWNSQRYPDRFAGQSWTRLYADERLYKQYAGNDAGEGEWDRKDILFPHSLRGQPPQKEFYDSFRRMPMADEMLLQFALAAMAAHELGADAIPDLLAISFSATDSVGHAFGADSQEMMDQILRLDRVLAQLFQELDRRVGRDKTLVVLTADHGSQPLVESLQARGQAARRVPSKFLEAKFTQAFARRFPGASGLLAYAAVPNFYLNEEAIRQQKLSLQDVTDTVVQVLHESGLVAAVYTKADFLKSAPPDDPYFELFRNSFFEPRSGHVMALLKPYIYLDDHIGGTGHGTPYEHDRHIPLFFMGAGIKPARYDKPCGPEDIAPTIGRLLGFDYPREYDARLLGEILPPAALAIPAAYESDRAVLRPENPAPPSTTAPSSRP